MTLDRLHQVRSVIFERQEEDRDLQIVLAERQTRAVMASVAGAAGWKQGVQQAMEWELVPTPGSDLPDVDAVIDLFGDGAEFDASDIPGLEDFFADVDREAG